MATRNLAAQAKRHEDAKNLCEMQYRLDKVSISQYASVTGMHCGEIQRITNTISHLKDHQYTDNSKGCWFCHSMIEANTS